MNPTAAVAYTATIISPASPNVTRTVQVETFAQLQTSLRNHLKGGWRVEKITRQVVQSEALTPEETACLHEQVPGFALATVGVDGRRDAGFGSFSFTSGLKR